MSTRLLSTVVRLPAVLPGPDNPLPPLTALEAAQQVSNVDELPADMRESVAYGKLDGVLPCLLQDGYGRERVEQDLPALVLENEYLRATILPTLGGRLYSLWHKESERDLVFRNPVLQPANLALRGAWFAGGVEWNLGSTGHTTLTCEPMHAARVTGPDGSPMLRLWEWERTRDLPYQLDFWLPADSEYLRVGARIRNPHDHDVPAYWWSNIAVEQTERTRVVAPAEQAWNYSYGGRLDLVPVPEGTGDDTDITYPSRHRNAADYFFDVDGERQPWIAALDGDGTGLVQLSTDRLRGRKLFVWGESDGGHRWQEWLSPDSEHGYLEIQAGLARTQLEHLRLPAGESWDWLEMYGPLSVDAVHDADWPTAVTAVRSALGDRAGESTVDEALTAWRTVADAGPDEALYTGSGWGALELERLRRAGNPVSLPGTPFPDSGLGTEQLSWLTVLAGAAATPDITTAPGGTLISAPWFDALEAAEPDWSIWYHRGVARWYADDRHGAVAAWKASAWDTANPWALRNLAVFARLSGEVSEAVELLRDALELAPGHRELAIEAVTAALAADQPDRAVELIDSLPGEVRALGRIRLLTAQALLAQDDVDGAESVYTRGFDVADVREGETSLSDTWTAIQRSRVAAGERARPLSARYDFRMADQ